MGRLVVILLLGSALLAVAGCGEEDRLSAEEFRAEANAICQRYNQAVGRVREPEDVVDVARYVRDARPALERVVEQLQALQPPEAAEGPFGRLVRSAERALGRADALERAARRGDERAIRRIADEARRLDRRDDALARRLGLERCAADPE